MNRQTASVIAAATLIGCGIVTGLLAQMNRQPVGVENLITGASPLPSICNDPCWTNENCDGDRLRCAWSDYEPSEGVYLWNTQPGSCPGHDTNSGAGNDIDAGIAAAYAHHKFIGISVTAGATSPHWLYSPSPGPNVYQFQLDPSDNNVNGDNFMPLIWDTVYQTKWHNFVNAFIAHIQTLPGFSAVRYIVTTGTAKGIDGRTWCQNMDASVDVSDGQYTDTGSGSGFCKVHSATLAKFLTRSNPNCTGSFNCVVGTQIMDTLDASGIFGGNALVVDHTTNGCTGTGIPCPDPTDTDVYVNKNTRTSQCVTTCVNIPHTYIMTWLIGLGEYYQMDQIAKSPPVGYPGLVGTANAQGMAGSSPGPVGNYVPAAETVIGFFFSAMNAGAKTSGIIFTASPPYATTQGVTDNQAIRNYNVAHYPANQYGEMTVARAANCPPHASLPINFAYLGPSGAQAIYGSNSPNIYQGSTCADKSFNALTDLFGSNLDHTDKYAETYTNDVASCDPTDAAYIPYNGALAHQFRATLHFYNLQPADVANITLR
jgi:hypothetical protein